ncbi:acyl carrier protein [Vogesella indigofera]|uniref:acyl carrier protein n=1 Tax=Vogesella indigofera TaxID=45465 RepID=UPI00234F5884|nr:acyl carrier protein [Vogesella indigofera]MDC7699476.1 acyl carrier protein [Vogesella indigofera]
MDKDDVMALVGKVLAGIAPEADLAGVGDDEDLRAALDLDSMDFLNLIIGLSQGSGMAIAEKDYPKLFTIKGIQDFLS